MSDKVFKSSEHLQADLIHEDKTGIHREAVRSSLDSSVQDQLIKSGYEVSQSRPVYQQGSSGGSRHVDYQKQEYPQHGDAGRSSGSFQHVDHRKQEYPQDGGAGRGSGGGERYKRTTPEAAQQQGGRYTAPTTENQVKAKYGNIENTVFENTVIGGAAGAATVLGASNDIINQDKTGIGADFVNSSFGDTVKSTLIKPSEAVAYAEKTWGAKGINEKKGFVKTVGGVVARNLEAAAGGGGGNGDLTDRTKGISTKYGYKAGKFAALGGFAVVRGTFRITRYSHKLTKDVAKGVLTGKEARLAALKRAGKSVSGSGSSIGKILKQEAIKGLEDFHGSDDLGMRALTKPKDVIVQTRRTLKIVTSTGKAVKKGVQGTAKAGQKVAQKAAEAVKYTVGAIKKAFSNPIVVKGTLIAGAVLFFIALILAIVSAVSSIIPTITLKSDDKELTRTYEHVTKLDAELTEEIRGIQTSWSNRNVDEFHYYVNGFETAAEGITIYTNADMILLYLDCKYDDYAFDKFIYGLFGGTNVKDEVTAIHKLLYSYSTHKWEEEIRHTSSYTDPETGERVDNSWTEIIVHMDINVSMTSFEAYLSDHIGEMLTQDEQDRMEAIKTAGIYTAKVRLGSPFKDESYFVSSRWGWRIHPISDALSKHTGIDIPKAAGTPINNVMYGTVSKVSFDADGYGHYVIVSWGENEVLYAHMSRVAVTQGQELKKGDIVGYVGSTGSSTGNHLHLEYSIDNGFNTNPAFFLEGASYTGSGAGSDNIVQVAASQLGNVGGRPYWSWYGFGSRVEWCACFVSWCADQCGYIEAGIIPKFAACTSQGVPWFRNHGLWQSGGGSYVPKAGDIIFFNWSGSKSSADHVGIVESCDGNTVYTIEGNSGDQCRRRTYNLYSSVILGYGTPAY